MNGNRVKFLGMKRAICEEIRMDRDTLRKLEKDLLNCLIQLGVITPNYQGEVILHFSEGGLTDIDRFEKSIRRRLDKNCRNNGTSNL